MIEIRNLTFRYGENPPLFSDLNWTVGRGESWAVLGASGCGKTTLLNILAGLKKYQSGTISIEGKHLERPRPETGLILQNHGLMPWATVAKNIELGFRIRRFYGPDGKHAPGNYKKDKKEEREKVLHIMEKTGLAQLSGRYPHQLSGGQLQRTAIARTLVLKPDLLLMDEPFSSLDAPTRDNLCKLVRTLDKENLYSRILVTHSIETALKMGDRILIFGNAGKEPVVLKNESGAEESIHRLLGAEFEREV